MKLLKQQEELIVKLNKLGMLGMADDLRNQFENEEIYSQVSFINRIEQLVSCQEAFSANRKYTRLVKNAHIRDSITFNQLRFNEKTDGITNDELAYLASNIWATDDIKNILIVGSTGVGKTALSSAIAYNLCKAGISVRCYRWGDFVNEVNIRKDDTRSIALFLKQIIKYTVVCFDDFGLQGKLDSKVAECLFHILDLRWRTKPVIFTSQLKVEGFELLFSKSTQSDAIIDRLLHPSRIVTLQGQSKR
jgi:DNA replication protein DnaC